MHIAILLALFLYEDVAGYSAGAPKSQCGSLKPGHGGSSQDLNSSPFLIKLNGSQLFQGTPAEIELTSDSSEFKGYMVQARAVSDDSIIGSFETVSDDAQYLNCGDKAQSSVTHKLSSKKNSIKLKWKPPSDFVGDAKMYATFVKDYSNYWVKVSSDINVQESAEAEPEPEGESEPEAEPEAEGEPEPEGETEPEPESESNPEPEAETEPNHKKLKAIYEGCGTQKSCFGAPGKCLSDYSCTLMASWKKIGDEFEFEMARKDGSGKYVAIGLSEDSSMGDELVIACANKNSAEVFWNSGKTKPTYLNDNSGISSYEFSSENGNTFCRLKSSGMLKSGKYSADLLQKSYALLLAGGPYLSTGNLGFHTVKEAADQPKKLELVSNAGSRSNLLFKLHGLFMLIAWIGCAGAGMIMARYFKQTWKGKKICGLDRWFQVHRFLMVLVVALSVAATIFILYETGIDPLRRIEINAHPVIGLVCVILALIQPIMAAFRPHPGDSGRKLFNWAHWGVGNLAHGFAICAIFLAGNLSAAKLSSIEWWPWAMVAYVVIYVLTHIILSILWARSEKSSKVETHPMSEINGNQKGRSNGSFVGEENKDLPGGTARKSLFALYFILAWVFVGFLGWTVFNVEI